MTRPLSDTQPYPNPTQTLSDDDLKLSTNRNAPRTMGSQGATDVAAFRSVCCHFKVARYSFSGPIPPKFEHKLRRHKQSFGKIATTVVLDKDENLL